MPMPNWRMPARNWTTPFRPLRENKQKLADGEIDYEEGKAEAEQELADARTELEDAQADLDAVEFPSWYVWDRDNNVSYNSFAGNVSKVEALSGVFPLFFFLVAALVVSTTMTRMVEEERLQIGTMKALGFDNRAIMRKYILYAMTAAVSGALFGLAVGFTVFPSVIWYAYAMMYYLPAFHPVWRWNYAIFSAGVPDSLHIAGDGGNRAYLAEGKPCRSHAAPGPQGRANGFCWNASARCGTG